MSHHISLPLSNSLAVLPPTASLRSAAPVGSAAGQSVSHLMPQSFHATDLTTLLIAALGRLKASLGGRVTFELDVEPELPRVGMEAATVEDILVKVAASLTRLTPDRPTVLTLGLGLREFDAAALADNRTARALAPGLYLTLQVSSRPEVQSSEAPVTSPDLAHALPGLEVHGAGLLVTPTPSGLAVRMLFPPLAKDAEPIPCGAAQWSPDSRRVLLADDDEAVRLIAARVLQLLKFEVTVAVDGEDALRVFESSPVPFRAVMLDIAMPNLDGISAAQEIRKICPTQPILFISGDASEEVVRRLPAGLTAGVIQKPFSAASIRTTLEQCVVNQVN
jgi:CheY-like chemotaxis protein